VWDVNRGLPTILEDGTRKYVWGAQGLSHNVAISGGAVEVYHADQIGTIRELTSGSDGTLVQTYTHDEYGVPTQATGSSAQPFRYTGELWDGGTGEPNLLYLRARSYEPGTGRFLAQDPVVGEPTDPCTWNRYIYARNNPINHTDPSGLWTCAVSAFVSGAGFGGTGGFSFSIALDDSGHRGVILGAAYGGGTGLGANLGLSIGVTNLPEIELLLGPFLNVGGSAGEFLAGGAEAIVDAARGIIGGQISLAGTIRLPFSVLEGIVIPGELHGVISNSGPNVFYLEGWQYAFVKSSSPGLAAALIACEELLDVLRGR